MKRIIVGSRGSRLAQTQTNWVMERIAKFCPDLEMDLRIIKTTGDRLGDVPLGSIGTRGAFVKELELALLSGEIDIAVHSLKDLPMDLPDGLCIAVVPRREDPRDCLVSPYDSLKALPPGARIGTGSPRRRAQLRSCRPDLEFVDLRGNLPTRLKKMETGRLDGIVLAVAGLVRLGYFSGQVHALEPEICLPAVGQGALAIEARDDDEDILSLVEGLEDEKTRREVEAEREFLRTLGGGCQVPAGALGRVDADGIVLEAAIMSPDGSRMVRMISTGDSRASREVGRSLALRLLEAGGSEILKVGKQVS